MTKIKTFLCKHKDYLLSGGIVILLYTLFLLVACAWPFGTNTLAHYDMFSQITELYGHIFDCINGTATIEFSNLVGGGANLVGVFLYFFLNPFFFVLFIFGRASLFFSVNLMYLLYFITISQVFTYFLHKKFKLLSSQKTIILSVLYTFCAYTLCNMTYIVWLNFLIILPLLVLSISKLVQTGKIIGFSIWTALLIYTSFAVGSSMQIILILLYFLYVIVVLPKQSRKKVLFDIFVGLFCALLMSLPILVPSFLQLVSSSRLSIQNPFYLYNNYGNTSCLLFNLLNSCLLLFVLIYLIRNFKNRKINQFLLYALIICNLPILFNDISKFIAGGTYFHYATRFLSINVMILFYAAALAFLHQEQNKTLYINENKKPPFYFYVLTIIFVALLALVIPMVYMAIGKTMSIGELNFDNFFTYLPLPLCFLLFVGLVILLYKTKLLSLKFVNCTVLIIICLESFVSSFIVITNGTKTTSATSCYYALTQSLDANARVVSDDSEIGSNGNLISGVSSYSIFSSVGENSTYLMTRYLDFESITPSSSNCMGSLFSNLMVGAQYLFSQRDYSTRPYLTEVDSSGAYKLYEYNIAFPRAFVLDNVTNLDIEANYIERLNTLAHTLGASDDIVHKNTNISTITLVEQTKDHTIYNVSFSADATGIAYFKNTSDFDTNRIIEKDDVVIGSSKYSYGSVDLEYLAVGESYNFNIKLEPNEMLTNDSFDIYMLSVDEVTSLSTTLNSRAVNISYTPTGYIIDATGLNNKNVLVLQANPKGMTYSSNNNSQTNAATCLLDFTYITGVNNETITAKFIYPYTKIILVLIIVAVLLVSTIFIIYTMKRHWFAIFEKPIYVIYIVVVFGIVSYFYFTAMITSFIKIICDIMEIL